jgi:hypothetical protein
MYMDQKNHVFFNFFFFNTCICNNFFLKYNLELAETQLQNKDKKIKKNFYRSLQNTKIVKKKPKNAFIVKSLFFRLDSKTQSFFFKI